MITQRYAHSRCYVIKEKNSEEEPIPPVMPQISGYCRKGKQCSNDKKTARDPLHTIKRYVLEHEILYIVFSEEDESFLLLPSKWKITILIRNGFDFDHCFE